MEIRLNNDEIMKKHNCDGLIIKPAIIVGYLICPIGKSSINLKLFMEYLLDTFYHYDMELLYHAFIGKANYTPKDKEDIYEIIIKSDNLYISTDDEILVVIIKSDRFHFKISRQLTDYKIVERDRKLNDLDIY